MQKRPSRAQYENMTQTPVNRLVIRLAIPAIISMLVTNIYNLVDTAFVGQLGTSESGAVGVVFGFMSIIQAFGFLFGQGAGSILSRALGQKDRERATIHASTAFCASFLFGLLISVVGFIWLDPIVRLLGSTETIAPHAKDYMVWMLVSAPFYASSLTLNNLLRYEGKAALGMVGLMTGAIVNIILDPLLMFTFGLRITGAAIATASSQILSWGILVSMYLRGRTEAKLSFKKIAFRDPRILGDIMATGFPSLLRQALNSITTVLLNSCCAPFGDAAVAAMSIVSRLIFFAFSIALGVGQGFQPVSAFNYGAGKYSRVRNGYKFTVMVAEGIIVVGCGLLLIFSGGLIQLFRDDPEVIRIGTRALRLQAAAHLVLPPCMCTEMLYQSTGHRLGASFLSSLRSGLLFIPALLILSSLRGLSGIQEALPVSLILSAPFAAFFAVHFFKKLPKEDAAVVAKT